MDSYVEGTLADCILSRKGEDREYWLETKATTISLYEAKFASQLGRYLAAYLIKSPQKRFNMILAVHDYRKRHMFDSIYDELDETNIKELIEVIISTADEKVKRIIQEADFRTIRQFFARAHCLNITSNVTDLQKWKKEGNLVFLYVCLVHPRDILLYPLHPIPPV